MPGWRVAGALDQLLDQLNSLAPNRSTAADGAIGDTAHAARRSDHNPRIFGWAPHPLVLARDFTHDPRGGLDCARLAAALRDTCDRRVAYVIWAGHIMSGYDQTHPAWQWRPYRGPNPHDKHLHLSVVPDARAQSRIPWLLPGVGQANATQPGVVLHSRPTVRMGSTGPAVALLRRYLGLPAGDTFTVDLDKAVRRYQAMRGLRVDGIVGPITWAQIDLGLSA